MPPSLTIEAYLRQLAPAPRKAVEALRALVHATVPEVTERISYGIPTFDLEGRYFVYVAGWKKHVSLYPFSSAMIDALGPAIESYLSGKGTLKFPLDRPLPADLIRRAIRARAKAWRQEQRT